MLAISSQIKELVSNFVAVRGKTWELVSRYRSFHSFRRQSLKKRKQGPRQLADDTIQSHVIKMVFFCLTSLLQSARKVRLWYFTLLPNHVTEGKGEKRGENEEKWKTEDVVDDLAGESVLISYCQFSRLLSYWNVRFWRQQTKLLTPVIIGTQTKVTWATNPRKYSKNTHFPDTPYLSVRHFKLSMKSVLTFLHRWLQQNGTEPYMDSC